MSDVNFRVVSVPRHAGTWAERLAVLSFARVGTSKNGYDLGTDSRVGDAAVKTLALWRRRCAQLREAGWGPADSLRFQYMRNCPPAAVVMRPREGNRRLRFCSLPGVCPWCWARNVVKRTWDVVTAVMTRLGDLWVRGHQGAYPHKLTLVTGSTQCDDNPAFPGSLLCELSTGMAKTKRAYAGFSTGLALLSHVSPYKGGWKSVQKALALVPWDHPSEERMTVTRPTRRNVAGIVGRFARYPRGMMYGDAGMAKRVLEDRRGHRLLRFAGAFSARYRPRAAEEDGAERFLDI